MMLIVAVLMQMIALALGPFEAVAEQAPPPAGLDIDGAFERSDNADLIDAILEMAPARPEDGLIDAEAPGSVLSAVSGDDIDWATEPASGVAYPVTGSLSVGVLYQMEEIEDLTSELIEMGTAGVDYTSHEVLVRAQWSFDLGEGLF